MNIGILGSGFGLYGYLPAIVDSGNTPVLLESRISKLISRPELAGYFDNCLVVSTLVDLIDACDALVLAIPPQEQSQILKSHILDSKLKHLFLEKPLGINSKQGQELIQLLVQHRQPFSLGYLFFWADWYEVLDNFINGTTNNQRLPLEIQWTVPRTESGWKSNTDIGGGLVHFFGTHIFALYSKLGYDVEDISIEFVEGELRVTGISANRPNLKSLVKYGDFAHFRISSAHDNKNLIFEDQNPFGAQNSIGIKDNRVPLLTKYIESILDKNYIDFIRIETLVNNIRSRAERVL